MPEGMRRKNLVLIVLLLQHIAILIQLLAHREVGHAHAVLAEIFQCLAGRIVLGAVIAGHSHHLPPAVIRGSHARFGHHAFKLRIEEPYMRQRNLARDHRRGRIMQRQLHAAQGKVRFLQTFPAAQRFDRRAVPLLVRENLIHMRPHALRQHIPRLAVLREQIGQLQAFARFQIPSAAGKGRRKLLLPEADAGNGQRADIIRTRAVIHSVNVQRTALAALLAGIHLQRGSDFFVVAVNDLTQLTVHLRIGRGHVFLVDVGLTLFDLALVLLHADLEDFRQTIVLLNAALFRRGTAHAERQH